ncbi:MAG: four helix bundle protein [Thermodesulfobacteriota bacterium]
MSERRKDEELAERLLQFAVRIIQLCSELPRNTAGYHVCQQLLASGTSPGANYEEARGAQSLADFISKISIVLKELKESRYWLNVILNVPLLKPERVLPLFRECEELIAIIGKSLSTARQSKKRALAASPTKSLQ